MTAPKRVRKKASIVDRLAPHEAQEVLRRLLAAQPHLRSAAERQAGELLGEVTFDAVAAEVEAAVRACGLEDLSCRAGRHEWGYVEPTEAAWGIFEVAVEPFVADLKRAIALGLESEALDLCKGVVLGLYRVERGKRGDLIEYASDFPAEAAVNAVQTWRTTRRRKETSRRGGLALPREFVDRHVPRWSEMLDPFSSREGKR